LFLFSQKFDEIHHFSDLLWFEGVNSFQDAFFS
jgi:hypothetical protein